MRMPALFIGHGSPMNAIHNESAYARTLTELGRSLPRPKGILMVSAHWLSTGTQVSSAEHPDTIHDFYGFPPALYEVRYPATGAPEVAYQVSLVVKSCGIWVDTTYGLDHGTWSVLRHLYPQADIPVTQLSIDVNKSPAEHWVLARELAILRDHGIMIMGSGNIVHNLRLADFGNPDAEPAGYTRRYDEKIRLAMEQKDEQTLLDYLSSDSDTRLAVNSAEHYIPLIYVMGTARPADPVQTVFEGFEHASISMRSIRLG